MKVKKLKLYTNNKRKPPVVSSLHLIANMGAEGDKSFGIENKHIRILTSDTTDWMANTQPRGLCFSRFNEHILLDTSGEPAYTPKTGDRICIGDALLEITAVGKGCFSECEREQTGVGCLLKDTCIYAKVIADGVIETDMDSHIV